jgi:hypothetical protein
MPIPCRYLIRSDQHVSSRVVHEITESPHATLSVGIIAEATNTTVSRQQNTRKSITLRHLNNIRDSCSGLWLRKWRHFTAIHAELVKRIAAVTHQGPRRAVHNTTGGFTTGCQICKPGHRTGGRGSCHSSGVVSIQQLSIARLAPTASATLIRHDCTRVLPPSCHATHT